MNELARLKKEYFGNSPAENEALLNKDLANLKLVYDAEILAAGDNATEKLRIDEAYEQAKLLFAGNTVCLQKRRTRILSCKASNGWRATGEKH